MQIIENKIASLAGRLPNILGHEEFSMSAVLLPLVYYNDELCVLFEKRSAELEVQPGEICFPGGTIEKSDRGEENAAIREGCEELGVKTGDIEIIAPLDIFVSPFNMIVYPFLARIKDYRQIRINKSEVDYIFFVPVQHLVNANPSQAKLELKPVFPESYPYDLVPNGRDYKYREAKYPQYFYLWKNEVIWGLTARILRHFIDLVVQ